MASFRGQQRGDSAMSDESRPPRVLAIYGNPKHGGFVHGCVDRVAEGLESRGALVDRLHLVDADVRDCAGCFTCVRTGECPIDDDMPDIIERVREADALLVGGSVRNSFFPALYKRFYERITYILGFGRDLHCKPVLTIGAVGVATGKKPLTEVLTMSVFHTHVVDSLFFRAGFPTKASPDDVAPKLDRAVERLFGAAAAPPKPRLRARLSMWLDDWSTRKFMLERVQDDSFDYVIRKWREKGVM